MLRPNGRPLSFEYLERKQLLAGDVVVNLVGGNLQITGDDAANEISMTAGEQAGSFVITGLASTTITQQGSTTPAPATGLVVTGVRGHVTVNLGDGADTVSVADAEFRRGLTIVTGAGADEVTVEDVAVGGVLSIVTGEGNDTVTLGPQDLPAAIPPAHADASVRADLGIDILLGDGEDSANVDSASARGVMAVGGGMGADQISLSQVRAAVLTAIGGPGDGADEIDVSNARAVVAVIATGAGADRVGIVDSAFTSLAAALGAGDDDLSVSGVASKFSLLAGGEGSGDELTDAGNNTLGRKLVFGFEVPENVNSSRPEEGWRGLGRLLANFAGWLRR